MRERASGRFLVAVIALVGVRLVASFVLPIYDDAYIIMRYGRNLAEGAGFVFNPGEWVLGATCPLFAMIQSLFFLLHLPMPEAILALNIATDLGILWLSWRILEHAGYESAKLWFAALFIMSPAIARIAVGAMEVNLYLFVALWAIMRFHSSTRWHAYAIASLGYFLRPEAVLLVALFLVLELRERRLLPAAKHALLALAIVTPGLLLIHFTYGSIIPQSVIAKSDWKTPTMFDPVRALLFNDIGSILSFPLALYGIVLAWRSHSILRTLASWTGLFVATYAIMRVFVYPWYAEGPHYVVALFASIALARGVALLAKRWSWLNAPAFAYCVLLCGPAIWLGVAALKGHSLVTRNVYHAVEAWSKSESLAGRTIIARDVGALGYYSDAAIFDLDGLVSPEAEKYRDSKHAVLTLLPEYVYFTNNRETANFFADSNIAARYALVRLFLASHVAPIDAALDSVTSEWSQDHVLFKRRD
jgi:hypothetical protein